MTPDDHARITRALNADIDELVASARIRHIQVPTDWPPPTGAVHAMNSWGFGAVAFGACLAAIAYKAL